MQSLFPQQGRGQETSAPAVQFRAGKCTMSAVQANGKYTVTSDPRGGKIALSKGNDGLMHFKWINALTNAVEDDRIVFPGEYTFKKVKTGRENCTDRVYMLKYQSGQQRLMYWLQDKDTEKDEETVKKVNDFLLNPNTVTVPAAGAGGAAAAGPPGQVVGPEEWMRLIGLNQGEGLQVPRAPAAAVANPAAAPAAAPFGNLDLSQILRTLAESGANPNSAAPAVPAPASEQPGSQQGDGSSSGGAEGQSEGNDNNSGSSNSGNNDADGDDRMEE